MSGVLPISSSGMNAAMQRLQAAANDIADPNSGVSLDQSVVEMMMAKISFEADARVAAAIAKTAQSLIDITV